MPYKIVFMGTPKFSVPVLDALVKSSYKISYVYTQPPKKSNRGQKLNISPIQEYAEKLKLNIRSPKSLNIDEELKFFKTIDPDIVIVVAYGQLISKKFLDIPKKGFVNIHASLLPRWRGAAPIQRAIMNLDKETGISIMKITEKLDTGPVMKQIKLNIDETFTAGEVSDNLSHLSAKNILEVLENIFKDKSKFIQQNHELATYANKIKKDESKINWNENAKNILAKINGLNPNPGAWFMYKDLRYKIWKASIIEKKDLPGTVLDNNFTISCKDRSIKIIEIQKEGKNKLLLKEFLLGMNFRVGDLVK